MLDRVRHFLGDMPRDYTPSNPILEATPDGVRLAFDIERGGRSIKAVFGPGVGATFGGRPVDVRANREGWQMIHKVLCELEATPAPPTNPLTPAQVREAFVAGLGRSRPDGLT
jgi:hypothetical protein